MGHIARRKIKDSDGQLKGGGMALTGLIIGYFSLLPILLIPLLLPALSSAKEAARKASAKNDMTQIVIAVKSFYTDYGIYPVAQISQSTGDITFGDGTSDNKVLINVLRAVEQDHSINTRQMTYIDLPQVRNLTEPRSGIDADGNFYDPWGHQYIIRIDSGYSGKIKTPDDQQLDTGVIVWSLGRDGKDIICSWK